MTRAIGLLYSFDVFKKKIIKNPIVRYIFSIKECSQLGCGSRRVALVWGCWCLNQAGGRGIAPLYGTEGTQPQGCPNTGIQYHFRWQLVPAAAPERRVVPVGPMSYSVLGKSLREWDGGGEGTIFHKIYRVHVAGLERRAAAELRLWGRFALKSFGWSEQKQMCAFFIYIFFNFSRD